MRTTWPGHAIRVWAPSQITRIVRGIAPRGTSCGNSCTRNYWYLTNLLALYCGMRRPTLRLSLHRYDWQICNGFKRSPVTCWKVVYAQTSQTETNIDNRGRTAVAAMQIPRSTVNVPIEPPRSARSGTGVAKVCNGTTTNSYRRVSSDGSYCPAWCA